MNKGIFLSVIVLVFLVLAIGAVLATPNGANVTFVSSSSAGSNLADNYTAYAGNVTELTVYGLSNTQAWQGYFGNVTGVVQLADASKHVMYNWSMANAKGEIYASNSSSITWSSIKCYNITANGAALETAYNISSSDVDGVGETFRLNNTAAFAVGGVSFSAGQCNNTKVYGPGGAGAFDEVLLTDNSNTVFTSILNNDVNGFDSKTHDFEMLVLDDGHNGDASPTMYYFYLELG